ncbi:PREDICTED: uncharacterized protein LOC109338765 [Lupinus angustifolius]|uniref:uncharacterized protein LOC109338765 n=1 Tax=Lupinus angustifolius TaxID=3871 RepID=UPI00092FD003|nr:PREDICTED: uncharacterized protein LOC109338765 [Lupinus angustifolius]
MTFEEYAAKFEDLARYASHYNQVRNKRSRCAKFQDRLRQDLKVMFVHQQIPDFATLVNRCWLYEESVKARNATLKSVVPPGNSYDPRKEFRARTWKGKALQPQPETLCFDIRKSPGHIKLMYPKLKKEEVNIVQVARPKAKGRVFTMSGAEIEGNEDLIQDERTFAVDLTCLPLSQLDIILGIDWMSNNHVLLNCFNKRLIFSDPKNLIESYYETKSTTANQLKRLLKDEAQVFMLFASLEKNSGDEIHNLPVVRDFSDVFPDDIPGLPLIREIEFAIDLDQEEHVKRLRIVLQILKDNQLYAKLSKCEFWLESVNFLGHVISSEGIVVDPAKVGTTMEWNYLKSVTGIISFIGLAGYYQKFIDGFSKLVLPLTMLTRKDKVFALTAKCEENFQEFKKRLTTTLVMILPDLKGKYNVYCDATKQGLGCMLMQQQKVVAYASRQIKTHELNYLTQD